MSHACHWPGCDRAVPPAMWGCSQHWFMLPARLQARIWATYVAGQEITKTPSRAYLTAAQEVQAWIAKEFGAQPDRHDHGRWDRLKRYVRERDEKRAIERAERAKENQDG